MTPQVALPNPSPPPWACFSECPLKYSSKLSKMSILNLLSSWNNVAKVRMFIT